MVLQDGDVLLRPLRRRDAAEWLRLRAVNADWLAPWEATMPPSEPSPALTFSRYVRSLDAEGRAGKAVHLAIELDGALAGRVSISGIMRGALSSAFIGYWVSREVAGQGVAPTALALAIDHCFTGLGLHRVEVNVRPENHASLRVVEKLGLRDEGLRERFLHIDGRWADHRSFALTADEVPEGMATRWRARHNHTGVIPIG